MTKIYHSIEIWKKIKISDFLYFYSQNIKNEPAGQQEIFIGPNKNSRIYLNACKKVSKKNGC